MKAWWKLDVERPAKSCTGVQRNINVQVLSVEGAVRRSLDQVIR
jgi:hypothetical protein